MGYSTENNAFDVKCEGYKTTLEVNGMEVTTLHIVGMKIHLRRRPLYFILHNIVPILLISCLSLYVYILPPESGEKISLGVTIVFSYFLLLMMLSDHVPHSGEGLPLLCE